MSLPARTSKTSKKLVVLPDKVQSQPIQSYPGTSKTDRPPAPPRSDGADGDRREQEDGDERSDAERMTKEERERNGFGRLTAYGELALRSLSPSLFSSFSLSFASAATSRSSSRREPDD